MKCTHYRITRLSSLKFVRSSNIQFSLYVLLCFPRQHATMSGILRSFKVPTLPNAVATTTVPAMFTSHPSQVSTCLPVSPAPNAMQFYMTPPPPIGSLPGIFPRSQPPVTVNPASSHSERFTISLLQFCHKSVRVCFGCSQSLKPGGNIPNPPHDLTITSKMQRSFTDPATGEVKSRLGNDYFHLSLDCIRRKQPYFMAQIATIPSNVAQHLKGEHLSLLRSLGYCI